MPPEIKPLKDKKFHVSYCKRGITKGLPDLTNIFGNKWFGLIENCYKLSH